MNRTIKEATVKRSSPQTFSAPASRHSEASTVRRLPRPLQLVPTRFVYDGRRYPVVARMRRLLSLAPAERPGVGP